jgi:hypothetical protein
MEPYLKKITDIDEEINEAETGFTMYLRWMASDSPIPKTASLLTGMLNHISKMKYSIYDFANCNDMLCGKIVYRTFIEQYLRFYYLFIRSFRQADDTLAIRYGNALDIMEDFACKRADAQTLQFYHDHDITTAEMWDALKVKRTDLAKYSLVEVEQMLQEFSWDGITRYLETSKEQAEPGGPSDLIYEHALTLCFIHGGPGLTDALDIYKSSDEAEKEFNRMCTSALDLCTAVKMYCCHLYGQYNKDLGVILKRLHTAAAKIHEE